MSSLWVPLRGNQDPAPRLHHCFHTLPSLSLQPLSIPWVATTWICPLGLKEDHGDWSLLPINKERMGDTEVLPGPGAPQGPALFQDCHLFLGLILNPFCWEQVLIPPSPPKTSAIVWRHFWLSQRWGLGRAVVLLASGGWKPGLLLNILQCSAQPQSRVIQTPMSLAPPLRSSALHKIPLLLTLTTAGHFCLPPEAWLGCDELVNQLIENSRVSVLAGSSLTFAWLIRRSEWWERHMRRWHIPVPGSEMPSRWRHVVAGRAHQAARVGRGVARDELSVWASARCCIWQKIIQAILRGWKRMEQDRREWIEMERIPDTESQDWF